MSSKKIAGIQIILALVTLALVIISWIVGGGIRWFHYSFNSAGDILSLLALIVAIAMFILAIIQIVRGAQESDGVGLAAGITGVLSFIPFVSIAALILNIIVYSKK